MNGADEHSCRLLGYFGLMVQGVLALSVLTCLFIKFMLERDPAMYRKLCCCVSSAPMERTFSVFLLDVSKQVVSSSFVHVINIAQAFLMREMDTDGASSNQCVWYLIGVVADCFLSTFFCCVILHAARPFLHRRCSIDIGAYEKIKQPSPTSNDNSISCWKWLQQTIVWVMIILYVRTGMLIIVYLLRNVLYDSVAVVVAPMESNMQLVLALVIVPFVGNNVQFWIQDTFLKSDHETTGDLPGLHVDKLSTRMAAVDIDPLASRRLLADDPDI